MFATTSRVSCLGGEIISIAVPCCCSGLGVGKVQPVAQGNKIRTAWTLHFDSETDKVRFGLCDIHSNQKGRFEREALAGERMCLVVPLVYSRASGSE